MYLASYLLLVSFWLTQDAKYITPLTTMLAAGPYWLNAARGLWIQAEG